MVTKKQMLLAETKKIIAQYTTKLTLRQIYYRLVAKLIIKNTTNEYKYLSKTLTEARWNQQLDFNVMVDAERKPDEWYYNFSTPKQYLEALFRSLEDRLDSYYINRWHTQSDFVEVWVEKAALTRLFQEVTQDCDVSLVTCKGYPSATLLYESARRISHEERTREVERVKILYFGDYDPSGKDIPRYIQERFWQYFGNLEVDVELVALNLDQIEEHSLPPVPTKKSDSRAQAFIEEYGDIAVELDALEPDILQKIIRDSINENWDEDKYDEDVVPEQETGQEWLNAWFNENWDSLEEMIKDARD